MEQYLSTKWLGPLFKKLNEIQHKRADELTIPGNVFGDPYELAKCYIEPDCSHVNPADEDEDIFISCVRGEVSKTVNHFLNGDLAVRGDGRSQMFVLSDAGMGKTSLLLMIKLSHLTSFWPKRYKCELFKLGKDTEESINIMAISGFPKHIKS